MQLPTSSFVIIFDSCSAVASFTTFVATDRRHHVEVALIDFLTLATMNIQKLFTKKNADLAKMWVYSAGVYGAAAGTIGLFFTADWVGGRLLKFIPLYNIKYEERPKDM